MVSSPLLLWHLHNSDLLTIPPEQSDNEYLKRTTKKPTAHKLEFVKWIGMNDWSHFAPNFLRRTFRRILPFRIRHCWICSSNCYDFISLFKLSGAINSRRKFPRARDDDSSTVANSLKNWLLTQMMPRHQLHEGGVRKLREEISSRRK